MKTYEVTYQETQWYSVRVQAQNETEAEKLADEGIQQGSITLEYSDYVDCETTRVEEVTE